MSEEKSDQKHRSKKHSSDINEDETVYNPVNKEDRKQKGHEQDEDEMEEFNSWTKKYNFVAKEIRKNAIEQEKQELENLKKSPITKYKYFIGSREDRILQLKEEQRLLEEMEKLAKEKEKKEPKKPNKKPVDEEESASSGSHSEEEKEDPNFKQMRKKYHETSKEMRKNSLMKEKDELKKKAKIDYVPEPPAERGKIVSEEIKGIDEVKKIATEKKSKKDKK